MNEGIAVYRSLSLEEREQRLLRSGIEAAFTPRSRQRLLKSESSLEDQGRGRSPVQVSRGDAADPYSAGIQGGTHRQRYRISVYNLAVVKLTPLGAGPGMRAASLSTIGQETGESAEGADAGHPGRGENRYSVGQLPAPGPERMAHLWSSLDGGRNFRRHVDSLAISSLYSLGLDSGEVLLTSMGSRRYVVEQVTPLLEAPGKPLPAPYAEAALALKRSLAAELPGRPGLLMGMDPEFLLLRESTGRVVPASRYLPMAGVAGCDAGPPGTRGAFPVAELRPQPRGEPRALLAQLMSAAATADRLIADRSLRWRAGGMPLAGWALGGHLHFSGVTLTAPLLRALDNYLALPIMLLEDARAGARRPRYGVLGDFRYQPHGGFEYRTLPSFLVSPVIAKGAVHLAHLIVSHYEDLPLRPLDREDLHAAYYSGNRTPLRAAFGPLAAQLRTLGGYRGAARYIEPLFHYIAAGRTWDESRDIRELWCGSKVHAH